MKHAMEWTSRVSQKPKEHTQNPDNSVMLGCYDVWSATPDNNVLCDDLYPQRESVETTS